MIQANIKTWLQTYLLSSSLMKSKLKNIFFSGFIVLFLLLNFSSLAQDTSRARKYLNQLSSKKMKGRGYLWKGHLKASQLIRNEMQKAGLAHVNGSYFQNFKISQNLFPVEPELLLNKKRLKAGADFIPVPECGSIRKRLTIKRLDSFFVHNGQTLFPASSKNEAWLISEKTSKKINKNDWKYLEQNGPALILIFKLKLLHSLSENQSGIPVIHILDSKISDQDSLLDVKVVAKVNPEIQTRNVIGFSKGFSHSDSTIIICAHYDHLGSLGQKVLFPGANDNASGSAMLLEMSHYFSKNPHKFNIAFIAFSGEEAGLLGSFYFVQHPLFPLSKIKFVLNLDLMGFGDKGATVVNGTFHTSHFEQLKRINEENKYLSIINARGKAANSDHYPFSEAGIPAFFIYTLGGPGYYHDVWDKSETVTLSHFKPTFQLLTSFINTL